MDTRLRHLNYRRAIHLTDSSRSQNLESDLHKAHKKLRSVGDRQVITPGGEVLEGRQFRYTSGVGVFLHIAGYTPKEPASIVPHQNDKDNAPVDTAPPPTGTDFMDGDMMALVRGNNIVVCVNNLHEANLSRYIMGILSKSNMPPDSRKFSIEKVANANKIELIRNQGVKSIRLDATMSEIDAQHSERKSLRKKLHGAILDEILGIFEKDKRLSDIQDAENLSASLTISFDRRKRGQVTREGLEKIANRLVRDRDDGFVIETLAGEKLRHDEVVLRKEAELMRLGKSVEYKATWDALEGYMAELEQQDNLDN